MADIDWSQFEMADGSPLPVPAPLAPAPSIVPDPNIFEIVQPRTWMDTVKNLGSSFSKGAVETGALASDWVPFVGDMGGPRKLGELLANSLTGSTAPIAPSRADLGLAQEQALPFQPDYSHASTGERYAGAAARMAPTAMLGGGILSALTAGVGGEVAKDAGAPEWVGQVGGGLLGPGLEAIAAPLTKAGIATSAGTKLVEAAGDEGTKRILSSASSVAPGRTFAEVVQSPGAANLQMQIGKELEGGAGNIIQSALDARGEARLNALRKLAPDAISGVPIDVRGSSLASGLADQAAQADKSLEDGMTSLSGGSSLDLTPDVRGSEIRNSASPIYKAAKDDVDSAWRDLAKTGQSIDMGSAIGRISEVVDQIDPLLGFSSDANKVISSVLEGVDPTKGKGMAMDVRNLQRIRSAAGEVMSNAFDRGKDQEGAVMSIVRDSIDESLKGAVVSGGMEPENLAALKNAIAKTAAFKNTFENSTVGSLLGRGQVAARESAIPGKIIGTPESAKAYMSAFGADPALAANARGALLSDLSGMSPAKWADAIEKRRPQYQSVFGEDLPKLEALAEKAKSGDSLSGVDLAKPSAIPHAVIGTPETAKDFMMRFGSDSKMVGQARGALLDDMVNKSKDNWAGYFAKNEPQFRHIFGGDASAVRTVVDDLASQTSIAQISQKGTGRGSITGQAQTTARWLADSGSIIRSMAGNSDKYVPLIGAYLGNFTGTVAGVAAAGVLKKMASLSEDGVRRLIVKAMIDPALAKSLMAPVSRSAVEKVIQGIGPLVAKVAAASDRLPSESPPPQSGAARGRPRGATPPSSSALGLSSPIPSSPLSASSSVSQARRDEKLYSTHSQSGSPLQPGGPLGSQTNSKYPSPNSRPTSIPTQGRYNPASVKSYISRQPPLVQAVIMTESSGNPDAKSPKGAAGLMGLMPATAARRGVKDVYHPEQNIRGGVAELQSEFEKWKEPHLALAAFNAGDGAIEKAIKSAARVGRPPTWTGIKPFLPAEAQEYPGTVASHLSKIVGA